MKDQAEPEQRDTGIVDDKKEHDELPQATASCTHTEEACDLSKLSDGKLLKVQVRWTIFSIGGKSAA